VEEGDEDEKSELGLGEGKEHHGDHFSCSTEEMVERRHCGERDGILLVVRPKRRNDSWYSKYSCFLKRKFPTSFLLEEKSAKTPGEETCTSAFVCIS
jgi:hypothetical protein